MKHHIKLHANKFIAILAAGAFATALMVVHGTPVATNGIKWADVVGEGGGALMVLTWFTLVLLGRPRGHVTDLLALGLGFLFTGMWFDALDEFWRLPATASWSSAMESIPNILGWVITTVGIFAWHREQLAITRQLRTREGDLRDHRQFDALTPVSRMAYFSARAEELRKSGANAHVIDFDVVGFRHLNARHGADACDGVLQTIGRVLALNLRDGDLVCRKGGDHFSVLVNSASDVDAAVMRDDLQKCLNSTCFRDAFGQRMDVELRAVLKPLPETRPAATFQASA